MKALALAFCMALSGIASAADAVFFRAVNLNGPALKVDGNAWRGKDAADVSAKGKTFANQAVALKPATDAARAEMIRSSVWGDNVDVEFREVPDGEYQVFVYVWEDNHSEQFDVLVNGTTVVEGFHSGAAGMWKRLGPLPTRSVSGKITIGARSASHGAANISGVEIWSGAGAVPMSDAGAKFVAKPTGEHVEFFEKRIRPMLVEHCYECHSATAKKIKGGLVLDSRAGVVKGGDTGPAVAPRDPAASLLIQAIRHQTEDVAMPPKKKLPPQVIADFEEWVKLGAPDPRTEDTVAAVKAKSAIDFEKGREWWSLKPLVSPQPPAVKNDGWPKNTVDRFILARIEEAGLVPTRDATPRSLIRRATYDLTGLLPTPEQAVAFDEEYRRDADGAMRKLVDRLLASPRYGERWGRHWLDVVRYADTAGDNSDFPIPQMHKYRDWVIASFNRDQPYDEFIGDQLAGDLRGGSGEERLQRIVATGYIANARRFGSRVADYPQHLTIEDTIDNLGRAFLGLSINCARCHDHKFDPISTQDYYALYGIFNSTRYPWPGIELEQKQRDLVPLVAPETLTEIEAEKKARDAEQKRLDDAVKELKKKKAPGAEVKAAEKAADEHRGKPPAFELAYAVADGKKRGDAAVQMKGDPAKPGEIVSRRFLTVLGGAALPADERGSGRDKLAEWMLAKENPLPARVMANRIWHYHFGRGIVPTPSDFGKQGKPPTHPELLDYLAVKFRDGGWSVKAMHREIMLSRTYRLAAGLDASQRERDPSNELLSAFPLRRLDAESLRDTLLALGGNLDLSPAGPHPFPPEREWKFTQHKPFKAVHESNRRSVYLMTQRIQRHPYLAIFDGADPSTSTPARPSSTTPLQALYLLNDPFVHAQAKLVAARIPPGNDMRRIVSTYRLILLRDPNPSELDKARKFLESTRTTVAGEDEQWSALVRVLFRLNEFVYLD